ncbi:MAG: AAA family ATPase, partial [Oscillospiraceae bacterium]|nr:AAA family ATPase [Oscillospiraceae bacterium]
MGIYLNPGNMQFKEAVDSEIYIDKSMLIAFTNKNARTLQKNICVSRPRRFGKSMAADMLVAYYSRGCDSIELFKDLKIAQHPSFEKHLNKYNVIHVNMLDELTESESVSKMIAALKKKILWELEEEFGEIRCYDWNDLVMVMKTIHNKTGQQFVIIIDEWDCLFRKYVNDTAAQKAYLDFLCLWMKGKSYIALAYMTGILPIKKYGEHSALNMFDEFSMTNQRDLAEFTGFTEQEVKDLCAQYDMPFEETKRWYDGYSLKGLSIYNPRSVVMSMSGHDFDSYWTKTETYESLKEYIQMDSFGLREIVTRLISGERYPVNPDKFQNDMVTFNSADDVLTLLIHLGYLTYDFATETAWIPNNEVQREFINSIEDGGWEHIMKSIRKSDELLEATINGKADIVA